MARMIRTSGAVFAAAASLASAAHVGFGNGPIIAWQASAVMAALGVGVVVILHETARRSALLAVPVEAKSTAHGVISCRREPVHWPGA